VPYSPLGRGFLTGQIRTPEDFAPDDFRRNAPRFQGENFDRNLRLVDRVRELATVRGCTPAQLALAWLLAQGDEIVPIPGTKKRSRLAENLGAVDVELTAEDLQALAELAPIGAAAGDRYANMGTIDA
jgi:aryl-alcohol dehydrogenase-like predicted oxidoreductase